jgi:hypothetical protein
MTPVRVLRRVFSADGMGLILIFVALQTLIYGLSSSVRNTDTRQFIWVCLVAAIIASGLSEQPERDRGVRGNDRSGYHRHMDPESASPS